MENGKRSHNVKQHRVFQELEQRELVYQIYEFLDELWNYTGFIPNPISLVAKKFNITATHVLIVILAWRESRMKESIYGPRITV
jgi:hypothetical protein